ncbi:conjugal transfer protein TraX [Escherichia coli]|uniref:conjugal transfer protein TraX n=1 Tax=Escherichia coli TaxID=562 RepID=UPI001FA98C8D|nr:conjugal transfer protein TraX [Escherichia coli]MCI5419342.1 conjugal transfer protein TraX [Escherichia coli]HBB8388142.1 conjugal transfer protein TraX [Escherichia coli]
MNKLPENSDQTKNVKKSPSITRIATRRIINIFVPLMETRLITNSVQHMLKQQKSRLEKFRQVNNKKAQLCLSWEEALLASHMSVDDLDRRFRRRRTAWRLCCWSLLAIALFLSGMLFAASSLSLMTLVRAISTLMLILSGVALCASRALIVTYRLWQLHERKVSEPEQGTFRDFLNDRNGWRNATLIAVTSKQY